MGSLDIKERGEDTGDLSCHLDDPPDCRTRTGCDFGNHTVSLDSYSTLYPLPGRFRLLPLKSLGLTVKPTPSGSMLSEYEEQSVIPLIIPTHTTKNVSRKVFLLEAEKSHFVSCSS